MENTIHKVTVGFTSQVFDKKTGECISQEFIAGDQVNYEDEYGEPIEGDNNLYFPLEMVQPEIVDPDIATGYLVSDWDCGITISIEATLNVKTWELVTKANSVDLDGLGCLERDFFAPDLKSQEKHSLDEEYELCPDCQEFLLRPVLIDTDKTNMVPSMECPNKSCQSNQ